jgi:hypothetical protein
MPYPLLFLIVKHLFDLLQEENYQRGYEWWLLKEAKSRNPNILTYALSWAFPAWVGDVQSNSPYTNITRLADYTIKFLLGAQREHGTFFLDWSFGTRADCIYYGT